MHKFEDIEADALLVFEGEKGMSLAIPPFGDDEDEVFPGAWAAAAIMGYLKTHPETLEEMYDWFSARLLEQEAESDGEEQEHS